MNRRSVAYSLFISADPRPRRFKAVIKGLHNSLLIDGLPIRRHVLIEIINGTFQRETFSPGNHPSYALGSWVQCGRVAERVRDGYYYSSCQRTHRQGVGNIYFSHKFRSIIHHQSLLFLQWNFMR